RSFLKGAIGGTGVALLLPPLEAMLNSSGTAYADGSSIANKFILGYFGNGGAKKQYSPAATGANFPISPQLQPFADLGLKKYLSVASGLTLYGHAGDAHDGEMSGALTAATGETLDQTIAQKWQANPALKTPMDTLHLRISLHR